MTLPGKKNSVTKTEATADDCDVSVESQECFVPLLPGYFTATKRVPLKFHSGPDGELRHRRIVLHLGISSLLFSALASGFGTLYALERNSPAIYAFSVESLLDVMSSLILIWQYLAPAVSATRERVSCILFGVLFLLSGIGVFVKATVDIWQQEKPAWNPVLFVLAGLAAAVCTVLAAAKYVIAKRIQSSSLMLDVVNSFVTAFCAVAIILSDLVYERSHKIWFLDAVMSLLAAVVMVLIAIKVLVSNYLESKNGGWQSKDSSLP